VPDGFVTRLPADRRLGRLRMILDCAVVLSPLFEVHRQFRCDLRRPCSVRGLQPLADPPVEGGPLWREDVLVPQLLVHGVAKSISSGFRPVGPNAEPRWSHKLLALG